MGNNPAAGTSIQNPQGTGRFYADGLITAVGQNYVVDVGASNALVGTLSAITPGATVAVAAGLRILLKSSNSLQVGANTLNLNATGAKSIVNISGKSIRTTIAAGAMLDLAYDGTNWQLINATY